MTKWTQFRFTGGEVVIYHFQNRVHEKFQVVNLKHVLNKRLYANIIEICTGIYIYTISFGTLLILERVMKTLKLLIA